MAGTTKSKPTTTNTIQLNSKHANTTSTSASKKFIRQTIKENSIFNFHSDFTDYISLQTNLSNSNCNFLVDTQADISVIKISSLTSELYYDTSEITLIKGITNDSMRCLGTISIELTIDNTIIEHKFHLVTDEFAIPTDGIIGKDFVKQHKAILNFETMQFILQLPFGKISTNINSELQQGVSMIPARSEVNRIFNICSVDFPCVIETQEISEGVLIPDTIVHEPNSWIRVTNTSESHRTITTNLNSTPMNDYNVYLPKNTKHKRDNELEKNLKLKIPKHAPRELLDLCMKYSHIFAMPGDDPSVNNFYSQKLNFKDDTPVFVKNYRLPQSQKEEISKQVKSLLEKDLIENSTSSFNSPIILVPKKSSDNKKKWRCIDYRMLNGKLIPDKFPLPRIEKILDNLGRAKYFSVMDLQSGFHQIPLLEEARPATAFSTENGFYQWKVLPFGISVGPSSFSRMMSMAFAGIKSEEAFIYMDDKVTLVFSEKIHLKNLKAVFDICDRYNLKVNP